MAIPNAKLPGIVERIRAGQSSLGQEARALGMSYRTTLITALRAYMGREQYDALMSGRRTSKGGIVKTTTPLHDDSKLPVVHSMKKSNGWSFRYVTEHDLRPMRVRINKGEKNEGDIYIQDGGQHILICTSPEGKEYTYAQQNEKAHLLYISNTDARPRRFVLYDKSEARQRVDAGHREGKELVKRGEAARTRKRKSGPGTQPNHDILNEAVAAGVAAGKKVHRKGKKTHRRKK